MTDEQHMSRISRLFDAPETPSYNTHLCYNPGGSEVARANRQAIFL